MALNPGVLSVIQYAIITVLLLTGWWARLLRKLNMHRATVFIWLTALVIASQLTISLAGPVKVNAGFVLVLIATVRCWREVVANYRYMLFSVTVFAGAVCYLIREISVLDPALLLLPAQWLQVGVLQLLAVLLVKGSWLRFALLTGGITLGYVLSMLRHLPEMPVWTLGDPAFFDLLWTSLLGMMVLESLSGRFSWERRLAKKPDETKG